MKFVRKLNDKGQITVPKEIRDIMSLHDGDIVEFQIINVHTPEIVQ
jgi:AbrB family looped-hinge helix DNA binding protein